MINSGNTIKDSPWRDDEEPERAGGGAAAGPEHAGAVHDLADGGALAGAGGQRTEPRADPAHRPKWGRSDCHSWCRTSPRVLIDVVIGLYAARRSGMGWLRNCWSEPSRTSRRASMVRRSCIG